MSNGTDEIIEYDGSDGGTTTNDGFESVTDSAIGNEGGIHEPEIIAGFDVESPVTERIGRTGSGDTGVKRTKSGKIDGRTVRGKRAKTTPESSPLTGVSIGDAIFAIHLTLSELTGAPEVAIPIDRAKAMADAIQEYGKYKSKVFDPEKVALFNLCAVAGGIYAKIGFDIRNRLRDEKTRAAARITAINNPPKTRTTAVQQPAPENTLYNVSPSEAFGEQTAAL